MRINQENIDIALVKNTIFNMKSLLKGRDDLIIKENNRIISKIEELVIRYEKMEDYALVYRLSMSAIDSCKLTLSKMISEKYQKIVNEGISYWTKLSENAKMKCKEEVNLDDYTTPNYW